MLEVFVKVCPSLVDSMSSLAPMSLVEYSRMDSAVIQSSFSL